MSDGTIKDVPILEITPETFIVPKGEEHLYHCRIEVKKFNAETGERLSTPRMQVFGAKFFETFGLHNLRQLGYTVDVLYNPTEWNKTHKAALQATRRQAEKEAMKQEIIAELAAKGMIKENPQSTDSADGTDDKPKRTRTRKTE